MKILIISSNLIGDTVLSTGVIDHFVKNYPDAKFTFLVGPTAAQIYQHFPALEKIIKIKKRSYNLHWFEMFLKNRKIKWDIVVDLRSSLLPYLLKAKKRFIFKKNNKLHHLDQLKNFFNLNNNFLNIYNSYREEEEVRENLNKNFKYIVIFPGGNWIPKIWPISNYNQLLIKLYKKYSHLKFIIVGSTIEEKKYFRNIKKNLPENLFVNLMGKSLTLTSAYMKKSNLFIGNDSGLMHLSVASNLPTITLFGPTNDKIYGHTKNNCFIIRTKESYDYFNKINVDPEKSYMLSINSDQVIDIIIRNKLL